MNCNLTEIFSFVYSADSYENASCQHGESQGDLFCQPEEKNEQPEITKKTAVSVQDIVLITGLHSATDIHFSNLPQHIHHFFELSVNAFTAIVHAWMSELPIEKEIIHFGKNILAAADTACNFAKHNPNDGPGTDKRRAADLAATNRTDPNVQAVSKAAYKVWHEIHRMQGLLRFIPGKGGVYTAHCEPDHFILPALGPHFKERFGNMYPWVIIDAKRRLCIRCAPVQPSTSNETFEFYSLDEDRTPSKPAPEGEWESLWRHYHKTINNESRKNPGLQQRFMPRRYWKYLTEM
jgi:hypothetical protein